MKLDLRNMCSYVLIIKDDMRSILLHTYMYILRAINVQDYQLSQRILHLRLERMKRRHFFVNAFHCLNCPKTTNFESRKLTHGQIYEECNF